MVEYHRAENRFCKFCQAHIEDGYNYSTIIVGKRIGRRKKISEKNSKIIKLYCKNCHGMTQKKLEQRKEFVKSISVLKKSKPSVKNEVKVIPRSLKQDSKKKLLKKLNKKQSKKPVNSLSAFLTKFWDLNNFIICFKKIIFLETGTERNSLNVWNRSNTLIWRTQVLEKK